MTVSIVFETHSLSEDNDRGIATGWLPGRLSERGRTLALELGDRRRHDGIDAVFASDLGRACETAAIALGDSGVPMLYDWRLRECDFGELNGAPVEHVHSDRMRYLDHPYPRGESWRQAVRRASGLLSDLRTRWDGRRVLVIGHVATRWASDHALLGTPLEALLGEDFGWRTGWEYRLGT